MGEREREREGRERERQLAKRVSDWGPFVNRTGRRRRGAWTRQKDRRETGEN